MTLSSSTSSSSSSSSHPVIPKPVCGCDKTHYPDTEMVDLFSSLFATDELAKVAMSHFRQVEWISPRKNFSTAYIRNKNGIAKITQAISISDEETVFSIKIINELIVKKYFIVFVKNFPVPKYDATLTICYALPAVVIFTSQKPRQEALSATYPPVEDAVGYAISRFPNLDVIPEDKRNAFVYSRLYMNFNNVRSASVHYSIDGAIGGGSELGNWFLELMRGNSCFALAYDWDRKSLGGFFHSNTTICVTSSLLSYSGLSQDVDTSLQNEITAFPENTSNACLCASLEPNALSLLPTQILMLTPLPRTLMTMILNYLSSWSLPPGYIAHGAVRV